MTDYKDQLIELLNEKVRRLENEKESQKFALYIFDCIRYPQPNRNIHDFEGEE
jgi:hypothetical protein